MCYYLLNQVIHQIGTIFLIKRYTFNTGITFNF